MTHDLAIVIISTNEAHWLEPCLRTVFAHAGGADLDVVVMDNSSTDGTRELVETSFPSARVVHSVNHGFAHANNQGAITCDARYILFLNPDTEIVDGTFGEMVELLDARPEVGLAGVRQITGDGELSPTMRRLPSIGRSLGHALVSERWPVRPAWACERILDMDRYEREFSADWTSGSCMFARREALWSAGLMDERFFIYSEEPDLCLRMMRDGWDIRHLPQMTIIHHADKAGVKPKMIAQDTYARMQYAHKHFSAPRRAGYLAAITFQYLLRAAASRRGPDAATKRRAARLAIKTLLNRAEPPFGAPPATAFPVTAEAPAGRGAHV